jgi:hypothetical protein
MAGMSKVAPIDQQQTRKPKRQTGISKVVGWDEKGGTNRPTTDKKTQVAGMELQQVSTSSNNHGWLRYTHDRQGWTQIGQRQAQTKSVGGDRPTTSWYSRRELRKNLVNLLKKATTKLESQC